MMDTAQFTDEQLTAFLDGEADAELYAQIEVALETNEALGEQLAGLDIPIAQIAQAYDALLTQAPPNARVACSSSRPLASWRWNLGNG